MKKSPWTKLEIGLLKTMTDWQMQVATGRSIDSVRCKRRSLGLPSIQPEVSATPTTVEDDKTASSNTYWKTQHSTLKKKYDGLLRDNASLAEISNLAQELAPRSYSPRPKVEDRQPGDSQPQSAVLLLTDTHVGQVIEPDQTLGFGDYNFDVFLNRLKFYENAVTSILRDHTTTAVPELVVCLGGDMLHGNLNHAAEVGQHVTLFEQFYGAGHAFAQFLRNLSRLVPKVRIYCTAGNHTRWGTQRKMPTENRFSNLDTFCYAYTEALTKDLNLEWHLDKQPVALFDVQGFKFHLSHGDELKGGDRALGIPNHAVGRLVSSKGQLFGKAKQAAPDYYLVGHLHREIVLPHAKGSFIVNGGFPGVDGYGLAAGFSPIDPSQVFFLVHPKFGKTATYSISLKLAKDGGPRPYEIPTFGGAE